MIRILALAVNHRAPENNNHVSRPPTTTSSSVAQTQDEHVSQRNPRLCGNFLKENIPKCPEVRGLSY